MAFMRRQSTRAEITEWEFTNEYDFGDFHGNAKEMLRRGFDIHLHYANFGIRRLMIRLPSGLPCDRRTFKAFQVEDCVEWIADKKGKGGILDIEPESDAGTYDEDIYDVDTLLHKLVLIRNLLINGDLRPLYIAWLACNYDEQSMEPPVPAGLGKLPRELKAMADFYELSNKLLEAAAKRSPRLSKASDAGETIKEWIAKQSPKELRTLVGKFLMNDTAEIRAKTLSRIREQSGAVTWPTAEPSRTWGQLRDSAG
ncbi:MAG: hypothetical protein ABSA16_03025 [Thermoguttaceae bacterium]